MLDLRAEIRNSVLNIFPMVRVKEGFEYYKKIYKLYLNSHTNLHFAIYLVLNKFVKLSL